MGNRSRLILLGIVVALCVGVGVAYVGISRSSYETGQSLIASSYAAMNAASPSEVLNAD